MNTLVISGGGSKGAFAGGIAEYLLSDSARDYQLFVGTSTGSLLAILLASGKIAQAKGVYTSVQQKDIFSVCPFLLKKLPDGTYRTKINHLGVIRMFLRRAKTFGDSTNLRKLIGKTFSVTDFHRMHDQGKEVVVTVANLSRQRLEYKSSRQYDYEDFCDWVWASANLVPFMSLLRKEDCDYADGGFGNVIPIQYAIGRGALAVDAIILRPVLREVHYGPAMNAFTVLNRTNDFMLNQISLDDLQIGHLEAAARHVKINYYFTPRILTENTFIFDPDQMSKWWQEGYDLAKSTVNKNNNFESSA